MSFLNSLNVNTEDPLLDVNKNSNSHFKDLISEIFKTDNIGTRSDLTNNQVLVFAKARLYANFYDVKLINDLLDNYMILALSKNRGSRKELIEASKSMQTGETEQSITEKLLG